MVLKARQRHLRHFRPFGRFPQAKTRIFAVLRQKHPNCIPSILLFEVRPSLWIPRLAFTDELFDLAHIRIRCSLFPSLHFRRAVDAPIVPRAIRYLTGLSPCFVVASASEWTVSWTRDLTPSDGGTGQSNLFNNYA